MLLFTPTPKCLPFSILCAKSVIIHTSITYKLMKTGVGVNCNVILNSDKLCGKMMLKGCVANSLYNLSAKKYVFRTCILCYHGIAVMVHSALAVNKNSYETKKVVA